MYEHFVIRSVKECDKLLEILKTWRKPFKVFVQDIYPLRTLDQNAYLWGVVYAYIAEYTGYTAIEIHKIYGRMYRLGYFPGKDGNWSLRIKSSTELNTREFSEYTDKVRCHGASFHGIYIPDPSECFTSEQNGMVQMRFTKEPTR